MKIPAAGKTAKVGRSVFVPIQSVIYIRAGTVPFGMVTAHENRIFTDLPRHVAVDGRHRRQLHRRPLLIGKDSAPFVEMHDIASDRRDLFGKRPVVTHDHLGEIAHRPGTREKGHTMSGANQFPGQRPDHTLRTAVTNGRQHSVHNLNNIHNTRG